MDIAIIRHLPTDWNRQGLLQGQKNISISFPLTTEVQAVIDKNLVQLRQLMPFQYVLTSELRRTKQTAMMYGFQQTKGEPLLNELHFGSFEGKPKIELQREYGKQWLYAPLEVTFGESLVQLQQRIRTFIEKYSHATSLLLFAHGSWTRALLSLLKNGDIQQMNQLTVNNNELIVIKDALYRL